MTLKKLDRPRYEGNYKTKEVFFRQRNVKAQLFPRVSQRIINHSPNGFNWGYGGSGPAQLSLAILMDIEDDSFAVKHYQKFKNDIIAELLKGDFVLYLEEIRAWIKNIKLGE